MEEYHLASLLIILLLELLIASDMILLSNSLVKASLSQTNSRKFTLYILAIFFKLILVLAFFMIISFQGYNFNIFGIRICTTKFFYLLASFLLISKNATEFIEIYNLKPGHIAHADNKFKPLSRLNIVIYLIYFSSLSAAESISLGISLTTNIIVIIWANVMAAIIVNMRPSFFVRSFNRFYRIRLIFIIFSGLLSLNLLLRCLGYSMDNSSLLGILVFTILCEIVSICCSKRHSQTGIRKNN